MRRNGKKNSLCLIQPLLFMLKNFPSFFISYFIHVLATNTQKEKDRRKTKKAHTHTKNYHYGISSQMYAPINIFHDYLLFLSNCWWIVSCFNIFFAQVRLIFRIQSNQAHKICLNSVSFIPKS